MIVDLFKSGMSLTELSSEYGIAKSTIIGWIKDVKEIKVAIIRIYKPNKGIYGAPRIHHILVTEGFNVSLKRVQRRMTEFGLCAITIKKYKHHSSKKKQYKV